MKLQAVLATPWRSTHRSLRWLTLGIFGVCCVGAVAIGLFMHAGHWWMVSTALYGAGIGYLWAFLMSVLLLVSIDARQLCLPGVGRAVGWSLCFYGLLGVVMPTAILALMGAPASLVALLVALAIAAGIAFVLLPRYVAVVIGFVPALAIGLQHIIAVPSVSDPRFIWWGPCALIVLLVVDGWRWRRLLHAGWDGEQGFSSAMVMQFRRQGAGALGRWGGLGRRSGSSQIRQRPDWQQARADLRGVGPQAPVLALRTALGGWYVPQSWSSYVRQAAPVLLPLLLFLPVMAIMQAGEAHGDVWRKVWMSIGVGVVVWLGIFGGLLLAVRAPLVLRQRWKRVNAELPLLALLPGLGSAEAVRRNLLRAALVKPLLAQTLLLALVLGAALAMHLNGEVLAFVTLSQLGCAGVVIASVLATLGGRDPSIWGTAALLIAAFALVSLSTFLPLATGFRTPWYPGLVVFLPLAGGWAVFAAALWWLGQRGWRALQRRPHPFLAN